MVFNNISRLRVLDDLQTWVTSYKTLHIFSHCGFSLQRDLSGEIPTALQATCGDRNKSRDLLSPIFFSKRDLTSLPSFWITGSSNIRRSDLKDRKLVKIKCYAGEQKNILLVVKDGKIYLFSILYFRVNVLQIQSGRIFFLTCAGNSLFFFYLTFWV